VSHQLHPSILEDLGLESALQQLVGEFEGAYRMPVDFVSPRSCAPRFRLPRPPRSTA
jgi:signal transduction histidine kinase